MGANKNLTHITKRPTPLFPRFVSRLVGPPLDPRLEKTPAGTNCNKQVQVDEDFKRAQG